MVARATETATRRGAHRRDRRRRRTGVEGWNLIWVVNWTQGRATTGRPGEICRAPAYRRQNSVRMLAAAATAALLSGSAPTPLHSQQTQPPPFKSGVDLLTLQTSVLDKDGRPITDLTPADFTVTVAGKPRKVLFARYRGGGPSGSGATGSPTAVPASPAAHADNTATAGGRLIMFVVDRDFDQKGIGEGAARIVHGHSGRAVPCGCGRSVEHSRRWSRSDARSCTGTR